MAELTPGLYWVRFSDEDEWTIGEYHEAACWTVIGTDEDFFTEVLQVGPRIEKPDGL